MSACAECYETFARVGEPDPDMAEVLEHWVEEHWNTPTMRRVLADTAVRSRCKGCGRFMTADVNVGHTGLYVDSYCEACIEEDRIRTVFVHGVSAEYVIENEVKGSEK